MAIMASVRFMSAGLAGLALFVLSGCGDKAAQGDERADRDPAITGALGDQIMVDPDLVGQNEANSGISGMAALGVEIPVEDRGPEAIAAAKAEAARLAGGMVRAAPVALSGGSEALAHAAVTAGEAARALDPGCAGQVEYGFGWAARLPAAFAVYPRAATQEAAGTDARGCGLRVVNFQTPVLAGDVIDYYATRLQAAGFRIQHRLDGSDDVLKGRKSGSAFEIRARKLDGGMTEVDLVVKGG